MEPAFPRCFWCDEVIEFNEAFFSGGKVQCRDCRDLDIMREFTDTVVDAVKRLRAQLLTRLVLDRSADMNATIEGLENGD